MAACGLGDHQHPLFSTRAHQSAVVFHPGVKQLAESFLLCVLSRATNRPSCVRVVSFASFMSITSRDDRSNPTAGRSNRS